MLSSPNRNAKNKFSSVLQYASVRQVWWRRLDKVSWRREKAWQDFTQNGWCTGGAQRSVGRCEGPSGKVTDRDSSAFQVRPAIAPGEAATTGEQLGSRCDADGDARRWCEWDMWCGFSKDRVSICNIFKSINVETLSYC